MPFSRDNELTTARTAHAHYRLLIGVLGTLLLSAMFFALAFGSVAIPFSEIVHSLFGQGDTQSRLIVIDLRLPRTLLAALIGALLACSGAAIQGLFRNALADPSLIGVTAGASLGASLAIFFGLSLNSFLPQFSEYKLLGLSIIAIGACLGGALAVILVYRIASRHGLTSVPTMLLAGIAITAFAGGMSNLLEFFSDNNTLRQLSLWRMGNIENASYLRVSIAAVVCTFILIITLRQANSLNAFLLGESEARHLGIPIEKTKAIIVVVVAIGTGMSVALAGTIVFVGLIVPHIMRMFTGPNHRRLIPASALAGALLLVCADLCARTLFSPIELPIGLLIAFIGAPVFVILLRRNLNYGF